MKLKFYDICKNTNLKTLYRCKCSAMFLLKRDFLFVYGRITLR